jgi:hypothetical protein
MACRSWLIRGLILAALSGIVAGIWYAHSYVSPESVRAALIATLGEQLAGAEVHVGSARMRVFGGISVRDLRLTRRGDTEPFFIAPTAVIYHDKEEINRGRLTIRKIELNEPHLRLECESDGTWNVAGLATADDSGRLVPTFVVTKATVTLIDRRPNGLPPLTLTDAKMNLLNDPLPLIRVDGHATVAMAGGTLRAAVAVRVNRLTGQVQTGVELPELDLGADLAKLAVAIRPEAAEYLSRLSGRAGLRADVSFNPEAADPVQYDVRVAVSDGRFTDTRLPGPVEQIAAVVHVRNGRVQVEQATAKVSGAAVELSLETREMLSLLPPIHGEVESNPLHVLENHLDHATVTVRGLALNDNLFMRLASDSPAHKLRQTFDPAGTAHLAYQFVRSPSGGWSRVVEFRPARLRLVYEKFRYPLDDVSGLIRMTIDHAGTDETTIDLTGSASGQRIEIKGIVSGDGPDPAIELKVSGTNLPIDDRLFDALPNPKYRLGLKKLRATGRGDFVAEIKQTHNVNLTENIFRISVYDAAFNYTAFPYMLENVRGKIGVFVTSTDPTRPVYPDRPNEAPPPDRVEFRDIEARNGPATFTLSGENEAVPGSKDRRLTLRIRGRDCPMDSQLRAALAAIRLDGVWRTFRPSGSVTFGVDVEIADRAAPPVEEYRPGGPLVMRDNVVAQLIKRAKEYADYEGSLFNPKTDLKLALNFRGPSITPDFFPLTLDDVAGRVRYDGKQVRVEHVTATRGVSQWSLTAGEVRYYDNGRIWANLGKLEVNPLVADADFLNALPGKLKTAAEQINLRGPAVVTVHHLVALTPPDPPHLGTEPLPPPRLLPVVRGQQADSPSLDKGEGNSSEPPDADVYWRGEVRLVGAALDAGLDWEQVRGVIACTGRYLGTHLGDVAGTIWLDEARIARHPVTNVKATFAAHPQEPDPNRPGHYYPPAVEVADLTGTLFRGTVGGAARVVLSDPVSYRLWLTATDVRLEDVARHHNLGNGAKLEGRAQGRIDLRTVPDPQTGELLLQGNGAVDVTQGHMLNLPVLLPLLKTLKLQAPDKTAFEEGHATFTIRGDRIRVDQLDLLGTAVSLGGSGELDTTGEYVKFEFYTIWSQTLQRWLTTPFGDVSAFVSEKLFKIELTRGSDGSLRYEPRVVPFVTAPFRAVAERMKQRREGTYRAVPGQ